MPRADGGPRWRKQVTQRGRPPTERGICGDDDSAGCHENEVVQIPVLQALPRGVLHDGHGEMRKLSLQGGLQLSGGLYGIV